METILLSVKLSISISINGSLVGFFSGKRGVRQRDLLFPLLFCFAEDVLSRAISNLVDKGILPPMASPRGLQTLTHVSYVDDIMIFCRGTKKNLWNLMDLFYTYGKVFGQIISLEKSNSFAGSIPQTE